MTIHTFRKDPELQRQARDLSQSVARPPSAPCTPTRGTRLSHSTVQLSFPKNTALKTTYQVRACVCVCVCVFESVPSRM